MDSIKELADIFKKYSRHPDYVGDEILDVNQPGGFDDVPQLKRVGSSFAGGKGVWLWTTDCEVPGYEGNFQFWITPQGSAGRAVLVAQVMESAW